MHQSPINTRSNKLRCSFKVSSECKTRADYELRSGGLIGALCCLWHFHPRGVSINMDDSWWLNWCLKLLLRQDGWKTSRKIPRSLSRRQIQRRLLTTNVWIPPPRSPSWVSSERVGSISPSATTDADAPLDHEKWEENLPIFLCLHHRWLWPWYGPAGFIFEPANLSKSNEGL